TFYVLGALPADYTGNSASALRIDSHMLAAFKTVGTSSDDGNVAVNFEETSGRYVMLVWTPSTQNANFSVAEVAVFGPASNAKLLAPNTTGGSSDDKTVRDSKDTKDFSKEIPGEGPAEEQGPAPELPRPPPFVFIPKVVPTSP